MNRTKYLLKKVPNSKNLYRTYRKVAGFFIRLIQPAIDRIGFYKATKMVGQPYFGYFYNAYQIESKRCEVMRQFIEQEAKENFRVLEIGTWVGQSACIWGNAIKKYNGTVICIDPLEYRNEMLDKGMNKAINNNQAVPLLLHNIRSSGLQDVVYLIKAPCKKMLEFLKEESFDFIFYDMGYNYQEIKEDLKAYSKFLKTGGVFCGDDYVKESHEYKIRAIKDVFGKDINNLHGFWFVRKY